MQVLASLKIEEKLPSFDGSILELVLIEYWKYNTSLSIITKGIIWRSIPWYSKGFKKKKYLPHHSWVMWPLLFRISVVFMSSVFYVKALLCLRHVMFRFLMYIIYIILCLGFVVSIVCLCRVCYSTFNRPRSSFRVYYV